VTRNYAWVVAGTAALVVFGAVGLARFAFGVVLPGMAEDLGLRYHDQGLLGASYFLGYLAIIAVMPWIAPKLGSRRLCVLGLALVALGLGAMSLLRDYAALSVAYFWVGAGSGAAFIGAMTLPAHWFHPSHRARAAGVATAGAGIGILTSGLLVPLVPATETFASWQVTWLVFGVVAGSFAGLAFVMLRDRPAELGLTPYGTSPPSPAAPAPRGKGLAGSWRFLVHLGVIYLIFAATALTYTTFIVTTMVDAFDVPRESAGWLFAFVGGLSIFSGALFGTVSDRIGHRAGMGLALLVQAVAYGIVATDTGFFGLGVSIVLFGCSAWSMPSIVVAAAGDVLGPEDAAAGIAVLTLMFAAGQVAGPAAAGVLADITGDFSVGYAMAAGLCGLAVVLCGLLKPVRPARRD